MKICIDRDVWSEMVRAIRMAHDPENIKVEIHSQDGMLVYDNGRLCVLHKKHYVWINPTELVERQRRGLERVLVEQVERVVASIIGGADVG